ncbi:tyrosine-type recombinase/integrase [Pseudorhodoplanes sp.]|jgi:integrase|uniref:tyrosine-type recombinase/integrase n=1 Tax=Pseudorhodoplanes sp. TaxID=1934341 RepID=UPI002BD19DCA|nr:tyrosine-type recombinase/integrase [Pseudorhodoplanes sp.]HWV42747.1 tyrosine-type recombinase/integrase [Pseudorhodoplanes sp.]
MPKVTLTKPFIERATCDPDKAKVDYFDTEQRGFMLEVRRSGGKTFYQRYTDERGRERQYKIGPADALTLDQARKKARVILAQALLGADPQARRRELREIPTLSELVRDRYLPHVKAYKRSWRTDETVFRVHILPVLGSRPMDEITGDAIADLIQRMRDKGYASGTTNRVLILMRFIFNLARKWKIPGVRDNPTYGLNTAPDVQRDRFLTPEETKRLIASINVDENRTAAQTIMLLLLTGARRNEVSHAKWEYVDWERRTLLVPVSKTGKPRAIALNGRAMALLRSIPRQGDNPYIFPSPVTGKPSPSLHFPWTRIKQRAILDDLRLHDLRHSFASFLVNEGVSLYVVQGLLGHTQPRTTQRYAHLAQETLNQAAEVAATVIASSADPGSPAPSANLNTVPASGVAS